MSSANMDGGNSPEYAVIEHLTDRLIAETRRGRRFRYIRYIFILTSIALVFFFAQYSFSDISTQINGGWKTYKTYSESLSSIGETAGKSTASIVVIPIEGIIVGDSVTTTAQGKNVNMAQKVRDALISAEKINGLKTIVLYIDSPGGSLYTSDEIYKGLKRFQNEYPEIRMVSYVSSMAASGGYYIAQAGEEIIANRNALVGSIGVIMKFYNVSGFAEKLGVGINVIKTGRYKDIGSMFRQMKLGEREMLQTLLDSALEQFVDVIEEGRGGRITRERITEIADGSVFSAAQAEDLSLIDGVASFVTFIEKEVGTIQDQDDEYGEVRVIIYKEPVNINSLLRSMAGLVAQELFQELYNQNTLPRVMAR